MVIDYSRCKISYEEGTIPLARFVYYDGTAAAWVENKRAGTATRVLYATGATFTKSNRARMAHTLEIPGQAPWQILQQHGGCGCNSPLKAYDIHTLLSPDFTSIP